MEKENYLLYVMLLGWCVDLQVNAVWSNIGYNWVTPCLVWLGGRVLSFSLNRCAAMETRSSPKFSLSMSQSKDAIFNFAYKRGNTHNTDKWITVTAM